MFFSSSMTRTRGAAAFMGMVDEGGGTAAGRRAVYPTGAVEAAELGKASDRIVPKHAPLLAMRSSLCAPDGRHVGSSCRRRGRRTRRCLHSATAGGRALAQRDLLDQIGERAKKPCRRRDQALTAPVASNVLQNTIASIAMPLFVVRCSCHAHSAAPRLVRRAPAGQVARPPCSDPGEVHCRNGLGTQATSALAGPPVRHSAVRRPRRVGADSRIAGARSAPAADCNPRPPGARNGRRLAPLDRSLLSRILAPFRPTLRIPDRFATGRANCEDIRP